MEFGKITGEIIDCAIRVHSALGPGLLESAYEICLVHELAKRQLHVARQVPVPVIYDGLRLDASYRLDIVVNDCVVVELKSVERLLPIHKAQLISYLRLANKQVGLLVNFNVIHLRDGIKRIVHGFPSASSVSSVVP